jgi:hypothetical protein
VLIIRPRQKFAFTTDGSIIIPFLTPQACINAILLPKDLTLPDANMDKSDIAGLRQSLEMDRVQATVHFNMSP